MRRTRIGAATTPRMKATNTPGVRWSAGARPAVTNACGVCSSNWGAPPPSTATTRPITSLTGTGPHIRESIAMLRWSPRTHSRPGPRVIENVTADGSSPGYT